MNRWLFPFQTLCVCYIYFFTWAVKLTASRVTERLHTNNLGGFNTTTARGSCSLAPLILWTAQGPVPPQLAMDEGRQSREKIKSTTDRKDEGFPRLFWLPLGLIHWLINWFVRKGHGSSLHTLSHLSSLLINDPQRTTGLVFLWTKRKITSILY